MKNEGLLTQCLQAANINKRTVSHTARIHTHKM